MVDTSVSGQIRSPREPLRQAKGGHAARPAYETQEPKLRYFGTDGIRDVAGEGRLAPAIVARVGWALAQFASRSAGRPRIVLARDTRPSGQVLSRMLAANMEAAGADVIDLGVLPTPALAWHVVDGGFDLGCMLSASHNPSDYNGIKPFLACGSKLSVEQERDVETLMDEAHQASPTAKWRGVLSAGDEAAGRYARWTSSWLSSFGTLDDVHVVLDLAAGAASTTAATVLKTLGARVTTMHEMGSRTINDDCGSEHTARWLAELARHPHAVGLAFDGDADRVVVGASDGTTLDGDDMLALLATGHQRRGGVPGDTVVSTVMSNLGLEEFLGRRSVKLVRAAVGDRNVATRMREHGSCLGGEPSGHVVMPREDLGASVLIGDGLVAGVRVLQEILAAGLSVAEAGSLRARVPQILVNVRMDARRPLDAWPAFQEEMKRQEALLDGVGRLVIRYSGTEPLLRIMAEGKDDALVTRAVNALADVARSATSDEHTSS